MTNTDQFTNKIFQVMEYAWKHIIPIRQLVMEDKPIPNVGDDNNYVLFTPENHRVVFSIEDQGTGIYKGKKGLGRCRHLSISVNHESHIPDPIEIDTIIEKFGFDSPIYHCFLWVERIPVAEEFLAVNLIEPVDGWKGQQDLQQLERNCISVFSLAYGDTLIQAVDKRRREQKNVDRVRTSSTQKGRTDENVDDE